MKTRITKPDGTVIEIEGTADEVADVVREAGGLPAQLAPVVSPMPFVGPYNPPLVPPARVPGPYEWVPDSQRFIITSADTLSAQRDIEPILGEA